MNKSMRSKYYQYDGSFHNPVAVVIGLCWMDYTDPEEIADAAGVDLEFVWEILESSDKRIRTYLKKGLPLGVHARVRKPIVCRKCNVRVTTVPCVSCRVRQRIKTSPLLWHPNRNTNEAQWRERCPECDTLINVEPHQVGIGKLCGACQRKRRQITRAMKESFILINQQERIAI